MLEQGPYGEWRPIETGARAIHVGTVATGEIEGTYDPPAPDPATKAARSERAKKAAEARWRKKEVAR